MRAWVYRRDGDGVFVRLPFARVERFFEGKDTLPRKGAESVVDLAFLYLHEDSLQQVDLMRVYVLDDGALDSEKWREVKRLSVTAAFSDFIPAEEGAPVGRGAFARRKLATQYHWEATAADKAALSEIYEARR
jgi:hypothetical protein